MKNRIRVNGQLFEAVGSDDATSVLADIRRVASKYGYDDVTTNTNGSRSYLEIRNDDTGFVGNPIFPVIHVAYDTNDGLVRIGGVFGVNGSGFQKRTHPFIISSEFDEMETYSVGEAIDKLEDFFKYEKRINDSITKDAEEEVSNWMKTPSYLLQHLNGNKFGAYRRKSNKYLSNLFGWKIPK